jgi:voltage-gated potassium channel
VIVLPLLRPLRLLRLIPLLSVLNRRAQIRLRGRVGIYIAGGASLLAFCAALAVLDAERSSPNANIRDFGDAIWWAVTTMTTVGYGDHYTVTAAGRLVAFGLMIGGIALLGTVTATVASWLVEAVAAEKEQAEDLQITVRRLEDKIDRLAAQETGDVSLS